MFESSYIKLITNICDMPSESTLHTYWSPDTLSVIGQTLYADISDNVLPILTTRKIMWKSIVYELLWFISGSRDIKYLKKNGVKIWDENASTESWNARDLGDRPYSEYIGPSYGYQWRYGDFGDQLSNAVMNLLKYKNSRRILICAWTPDSVKNTVLPPCHFTYQFVVKDDHLHTIVYMRSGDLILGIPFNIVSYSVLTMIIAKITNMLPGSVTLMIGDAHVYSNHIEKFKQKQLSSPILQPPYFDCDWITQRFTRESLLSEISIFFDNLSQCSEKIINSLVNYQSGPFITYKMTNTSITH